MFYYFDALFCGYWLHFLSVVFVRSDEICNCISSYIILLFHSCTFITRYPYPILQIGISRAFSPWCAGSDFEFKERCKALPDVFRCHIYSENLMCVLTYHPIWKYSNFVNRISWCSLLQLKYPFQQFNLYDRNLRYVLNKRVASNLYTKVDVWV